MKLKKIRYIIKILTKNFNSIKIRNKLLLSYIVVVLLPVLFVGVFLTNNMKNTVIKNSIGNAVVNVDKLKTRVQQVLNVTVDISERMFSDAALFNLVTTHYETSWDAVNALYNYKEFDTYMSLNHEIGDIRFYTENQTLFDNWRFTVVTDEIRNSSWYKNAIKQNGILSWEYLYNESLQGYCLSLTRLIFDDKLTKLGVVVIAINPKYLYDVVKQESFETIVSMKNNIFASSDNEVEEAKFSNLKINILGGTNKLKDVLYRGKSSKMISLNFKDKKERGNFNITAFAPISQITQNTKKVSMLAFTIIGISLFLSGILIYFFSNAISNRLSKLSRQMRKSVDEDFNAQIPIEIEGEDEIGQLSSDLSTMVKNIQRLVNEIYHMANQQKELAIQQKDIEFKMLANQINPHFLYNAMESIRMKCLSKGDGETANMVKLFAKLMRRNLEVSSESVLLSSELDFVKNYLEVQKFRFESKIEYNINVLCDISEYKILPLLIQPIVENAFVHGLEAKSGKGQIIINIEEEENFLDISVIDDGKGIEKEKLNRISECLQNCEYIESKRIGLFNVNSRIKLFYGKEYGLTIFSGIDVGTRIDILLPKDMGELDYAKVINS